jgi:ubiquinone/menaquinone biosynthesis C-methylase UbiE
LERVLKDHLKAIAKSYDKAIDSGLKGINAYNQLPKFITDDPKFELFRRMQREGELSDSNRKEIYSFLSPEKGMRFIDLGCCLNLMFSGYSDWKSVYHGVDISPKTIKLLRKYSKKEHVPIGALECCSMHDTPFDDKYFDIGCCIGSIEYFEKEFIEEVLREIYRILKPSAKFVLDIPNVGSPEFEITSVIEEYLGRKDRFNMTVEEFENTLRQYFRTEAKEVVGPMIQYFVTRKRSFPASTDETP